MTVGAPEIRKAADIRVEAAVEDFRIGIPGMLLQVFGGYLFLKYVIRK